MKKARGRIYREHATICGGGGGGVERNEIYMYIYSGMCISYLWKSIRNSHIGCFKGEDHGSWGTRLKRHSTVYCWILFGFWTMPINYLAKKRKQIKLNLKKARKSWLTVMYTNEGLLSSHKKKPKLTCSAAQGCLVLSFLPGPPSWEDWLFIPMAASSWQ